MVVYMPMIPETVAAMLACARIGAVHSVVFGGFAAAELALRIDDALPVVVVAASCGVEPTRVVDYFDLLDKAVRIAEHRPRAVVVKQRDEASYFSAHEGHYLSGDGGYVDEDGYLFVMGRTGDVINVAGHRLSTGSIEAVIARHPDVAECAVIGAADPVKGQSRAVSSCSRPAAMSMSNA